MIALRPVGQIADPLVKVGLPGYVRLILVLQLTRNWVFEPSLSSLKLTRHSGAAQSQTVKSPLEPTLELDKPCPARTPRLHLVPVFFSSLGHCPKQTLPLVYWEHRVTVQTATTQPGGPTLSHSPDWPPESILGKFSVNMCKSLDTLACSKGMRGTLGNFH